jgi:hypothetical protein
LYLESEEKIRLFEGAGAKDDLTKDEGGLFQNPAQAGYKKHRNGKQEQDSIMRPNFALIQFLHQ